MTDGKAGRKRASGEVIKIRVSPETKDYLARVQAENGIRERSAAGGAVLDLAAKLRLLLPPASAHD